MNRHFPVRVTALLFVLVGLGLDNGARAQNDDNDPRPRFISVGTGAVSGTYFQIGGLIANAISNPPGSRPCDVGGSCGVPGVVAVAKATHGSADNVMQVHRGRLETCLSQGDVAYWAYRGLGLYKNTEPIPDLRAIANLYPESLHIVVRADSPISRVADLAGMRISLGEEGSGTLIAAREILRTASLSEGDVNARYMKLGTAADALAAGDIAGFLQIAGHPVNAITELASREHIRLLPLDNDHIERLRVQFPFYSPFTLPAGTYPGIGATQTMSVSALWITSAKIDEELVYGLTKALWSEGTRKIFENGHPRAAGIRIESALQGVAIPLHPGAERYYRERGIIKP